MNSLQVQLRKFVALTGAERLVLLRAAALLPLFSLGLRLLGLPRFQALLQRSPVIANSEMPLAEVRALGRIVNMAAARTLGPRSCLVRSLLLQWLLQRRGVECDLRIGVRLTDGALDAHAWVECDGVPVNDQPDMAAQFASFGDLVPLQAFQTP